MSERVDTGKWKTNLSKKPKDVEEEYDRISTFYDSDLAHKGYSAPVDAARILSDFIPIKGIHVLDAGCGTGLVGMSLKKHGFTKITGVDISANCLKEAKAKDAYTSTMKHNLLEPFPVEDAAFGAVTCIGVCSRFDDSEILMLVKEFARITETGGIILISHREDLMKSSKLPEEIDNHPHLCVGLETVTETYPYIPMDENYKDIGVRYIVLRKNG